MSIAVSPLAFLLRPPEETAETAAFLERKGWRCTSESALDIREVKAARAVLDEAVAAKPRAMAVTSRHALPPLARLAETREIPLYAVGAATARAARKLGFSRVEEGGGTARALTDLLCALPMRRDEFLLYARGRDIAMDMADCIAQTGRGMREVVVYAAHARPALSGETREALRSEEVLVAAVYSRRGLAALETWLRKESLGAHTARATMLLCFSASIARAAQPDLWRRVLAASTPTESAMREAFQRLYAEAGHITP
jgi:uroporphyrinogen-III synthase